MERIESVKFYTNGIPMWRISITYIMRFKNSNKINLSSASFDLPEDGHLEIGNSNHQNSHVQVIGYTPNETLKVFQHLDKPTLPDSDVQCHFLGEVIVIPPKQILGIETIENEPKIWWL